MRWLGMGSGSSASAPAGRAVGEEDVQAATPLKTRSAVINADITDRTAWLLD